MLAFYMENANQNANLKNSQKFSCKKCNFTTSRKSHFDKHLFTAKHISSFYANHENDKIKNYVCECGKLYKHNSSFHRHKRSCDFEIKNTCKKIAETKFIETDLALVKDSDDYKSMFIKIINENSEMKSLLVEQQKQLGEQQKQIGELIPRIGNNTNNIKQKFNINVFLNEQCKDAMTMSKFLDDIKITIEDLFVTKNKGITEGVSNLFIKNMNKLSLYERPIHCTDVKRETVYIKSEGSDGETAEWQKDTEQEKLKQAISDMTFVQSKNLKLYTDQNPDWMDKEDKQSEYVLMMKNCMDDIKKDNRREKIIKKLCNSVYYNGDK